MFDDPYSVTTFLARRRRPRRRILSLSDHWTFVDGQYRRDVLVRLPDGQVVVEHLADDHPAVRSFCARAAVAA